MKPLLLVGAALFLASCGEVSNDSVVISQAELIEFTRTMQTARIIIKTQQDYIIKLQNKCYGSEI